MKKKIAFFIDSQKNAGGAFQEAQYLIKNILKKNVDFEIVIVSPNQIDISKVQILKIKLNLIDKINCYLRVNSFFFHKFFNKFFPKNKFEKFFDDNKIDLIFFLNASQYIQYIENINFIVNIPDVSHRKNLEFPEIRNNSEFEIRERIYKNFLPKAFSIITNSESIKEDLIRYYKLDNNRIDIISHQPSEQITNFQYDKKKAMDIKKKFGLPKNYVFYPAQYWAHKNHKLIIDSIKFLNDKKKLDFYAIFSGHDKGNLKYLKDYCNRINISKNVIFMNFLEEDDMGYFYKMSSSLVMPSYFGPTNIPPLEAFFLGVPSIYLDNHFNRQEFGDSLYYVKPNNAEHMAHAINLVKDDHKLRESLIKNGYEKLDQLTKNKAENLLPEIFNRYFKIQETWK